MFQITHTINFHRAFLLINPKSARDRYLANSLTSFLNLGVSAFLSILSAPIAIKTWGTEGFAISILITTLNAYLVLLNLGYAQAAEILLTMELKEDARINIIKDTIKKIKITIFAFLVTAICFGFFFKETALSVVQFLIPPAKTEHVNFILFYFAANIFSLVLNISGAILRSLQFVHIDNIVNGLAAPLSFLILILSREFHLNIDKYILLISFIPLLAGMAKTLILKRISQRDANTHHSVKKTDYNSTPDSPRNPELNKTAIRLFGIQATGLLVWNTDSIIIGQILGPQQLTVYNLNFRVASLFFAILGILSQSLMPIMGKAYSNHDWPFLRRTYQKASIIMMFIGGWLTIVLAYANKPFVQAWVGDVGSVNISFTIFLGLYCFILSQVNLQAGLLNALNLNSGGVTYALAEGLIKVTVSILLTRHFGITGAAAAMFIGCAAVPFWICPILIKNRTRGQILADWRMLGKFLAIAIFPSITTICILTEYPSLEQSLVGTLIKATVVLLYYPLIGLWLLEINLSKLRHVFLKFR